MIILTGFIIGAVIGALAVWLSEGTARTAAENKQLRTTIGKIHTLASDAADTGQPLAVQILDETRDLYRTLPPA